jgi:hypothetical protein
MAPTVPSGVSGKKVKAASVAPASTAPIMQQVLDLESYEDVQKAANEMRNKLASEYAKKGPSGLNYAVLDEVLEAAKVCGVKLYRIVFRFLNR